MKNGCIVLKTGLLSVEELYSATEAFSRGGYAFDEIRLLPYKKGVNLTQTLSAMKKETENLLLLVEPIALPFARKALSGLYLENGFQGEQALPALYQEKDRTLFLLETGDSIRIYEQVKTLCIPFLDKKYGVRHDKITIRCVGANETHVDGLIAKAKGYNQAITYTHVRKHDEDVVEIVYGQGVPKMTVDDVLRLFADGLGDTVYALDDTPLEKQLVNLLKLRGKKISVAESFTGGGVGRRIVSVSGASEVYFEGLNTYNEDSKIKRLGVSAYTLKTFGAVSDRTACEMAAGLLNTGDCDISIATTGLAGPKTDRSLLPIGLCYIAIGTKERVFVYRYKFDGTRSEITEKAINYALFLAYRHLKDM